jgi:hypothetical protein
MKYFNNINSLEQAKLYYRKLAKQLHPDKGGSVTEFQQLQKEYKTVLLQLHNSKDIVCNGSTKYELINELGKLAKVLIKKQVPQMYLRHKINKSKSPVEKGLFSEIALIIDIILKS